MEGPSDLNNSAPTIEHVDHQAVIPDFEVDALARCLLPAIKAYYETSEGQKAFEEWQRQQNT